MSWAGLGVLTRIAVQSRVTIVMVARGVRLFDGCGRGGRGMCKRCLWVAVVRVFLLSGGLAGCPSPTITYGSGPFSATDVDKIVKGG